MEGKHLIPQGKDLILNISYRMNDFRLSSNLDNVSENLDSKIQHLLALPPLVRFDNEGRVWDLNSGKSLRENFIIKVIHADNRIEYFSTTTECAKNFNISRTTILKGLDEGKPLKASNSKLQRIRVYGPNL
jgi:hypothetical protein